MKTAEEVAFEVLYREHGKGFSRPMFRALLADDDEIGKGFRSMRRMISTAIDLDRSQRDAVHAAELAAARSGKS